MARLKHGINFRFFCHIFLVLLAIIGKAFSLGASTDTYTWGGDYLRHGYQTNHNMDPAIVGSPNFGQIFNVKLPGNFNGIGAEQIFSQPLTFTGDDGVQYIYVATSQNNIYKLNAKTGAILASRNLHVPFLTADLDNCVDINPAIGVTATGTIDPATGIWYLTSKTYSSQFQDGKFGPTKPPGVLNGRAYFHGIDTQSSNLTDAFDPVLLDGRTFRNNPKRMFIGGHQHSRPALVLAGDYVYTGYASHCVLYNFTGAIIGHNKKTGDVVEMYAMEGGPEPNTVRGGGVWMSGGGIAYDGSSLFFATGNGYASQLAGTPLPGRQPPSALEEAAVNAKVKDDGTINVIDFFMPWEKVQLDGADKDLGTTPLELLPTNTFTCPNVKRMGVLTGKSGKTYVLNLDNLGGYQMGANKLDNVVFMYQNENSVYAGAGVMPLGGGYIYINVIGYRTRVFKFSCDGNGNPQFTVVAYTSEVNAYVLGTGHGTTTSLKGQDGSGLYWVVDVAGTNLRIYNAIPPAGGNLTLINAFNIPGITKFTRASFGNGLVYLGTTTGNLYAFGSPVNLPLNCSSPYQFGTVPLKNSSAPLTITCVAIIATTVTGAGLNSNPNFMLSSLPSSSLQLAQGASFKFQATFHPQSVGPLSGDAIINTTNGVAGYSTSTSVTLVGTGNSAAPLLRVGPNTLSFSVIAGQQPGGVNQSSIWSNAGDSLLTIQSVRYSLTSERGPWVTPNISAAGVGVGPFTFVSVPAAIPANSQTAIIVNYNPGAAGNDGCYVSIVSDGGTSILDVVAVAGTYPRALIEFQSYDGSGWVTLDPSKNFSFGNVTESQTKYLQLRVTNNGSSTAVALSITVSKPPYGIPGIVGAVNDVDLTEGTLLAAGQSATASLYCSVPKSQVNIPSYSGMAQWIMNTGDPNLGKQFMNFTCNAVAEQVGPLFANKSAKYAYIGCFLDNNPGRQMAYQAYGDASNSNGRCISTCSSSGWLFASTSYQQECWCGNAIPITRNAETDCNYACTGNINETCGGNGYFHDHARLSVFANISAYANITSPPLSIPASIGQYKYVGCYAERGGKALGAKTTTDPRLMTVEMCAAFCSSYSMFSLEFAQECFCGNSINKSYASLAADSNCQTMACKGNNSEFCGAGNLGQIYSLDGIKASISSISSTATSTGSPTTATSTNAVALPSLANYTYLGCYNETHDRRALNAAGQDVSTNSLNSCAAFCQSYHYFGVEYSSQCYCASSLYANSIKQSTDVGCNMACAGNSSQICGGPDFLNVYQANNTMSLATTTTRSGTAPTATSGPRTVASVGRFAYIGCYNEVGGRALSAASVSNSSMTVELCAAFCTNYQYFSVEYSSECYCGNSISSGSTASSSNSCTMTCTANANEYCGGAGWMNMYQINMTTASTTSGASTIPSLSSSASPTTVPSRIGNYTSLGCWTDNVNGRALSNEYSNNSMSLELCASHAQAATARYFGVEYGTECWYGQTIAGGNNVTVQSNCNFKCPGDPAEFCGAGNFLQMYNFSVLSVTTSASLTSSTASMSTASFGSLAGSSLLTPSSDNASTSITVSASSTPSSSAVLSTNSTSSSPLALRSSLSALGASTTSTIFTTPLSLNASSFPPLESLFSSEQSTSSLAGSVAQTTTNSSGSTQSSSVASESSTLVLSIISRSLPSSSTFETSSSTASSSVSISQSSAAPISETLISTINSSQAPSSSLTTASSTTPSIPSSTQQSTSSSLSSSKGTSLSPIEVVSSSTKRSESASMTSSSINFRSEISTSSSSVISSLLITVPSSQLSSSSAAEISSSTSTNSFLPATSSSASSTSSSSATSKSLETPISGSSRSTTSQASSSLVSASSQLGLSSRSLSSGSSSLLAPIGSGNTGANSAEMTVSSFPAITTWLSWMQFSGLSTASSTSVEPSPTSSTSQISAGLKTDSSLPIPSSGQITSSVTSLVISSSASDLQSASTVLSLSSTTSSSISASLRISSSSPFVTDVSSGSVGPFTPQSSTVPVLTSSLGQSLTATLTHISSFSEPSTLSHSSSTSSAPTALASVASYTYQGCYSETTGRTFNSTYLVNNSGMTVPMCAAYCDAYAYFGVEYATQCFCGPFRRFGSAKVPNQSDCKMACAGDRLTLCGGANRLSVYGSSDPKKVNHVPSSPQSVNGYNFYNCVVDSPRLLKTKLFSTSTMSVEICLQAASAQGYRYAGLEYGRECWVSSSLQHSLINATTNACSMICAGDAGQLCGAALRMSLYIRGGQ